MVTHAVTKYRIQPFWDDGYQSLEYITEPFNDPDSVALWTQQGYTDRFTGAMCDMRSTQPAWNWQFIEFFANQGWQDIGTSYYRMMPGTVQPTHSDLYARYVKLYDLQGREHTIRRAIVFLEAWQPGHYGEHLDQPFVLWQAGDVVEWTYDTPHMAANCGSQPRYTLQITGHV